jgi:ribosomal protein S18 acetylase RimI-like enzyme
MLACATVVLPGIRLTAMDYAVRALVEEDWSLLRGLRLQALADSPHAFASTLDHARQLTEEGWRERARGTGHSATFIAFTDSQPIALTAVLVEDNHSAQAVSVWVHPDYRRRGVAAALMKAAAAFAFEWEARVIRVWVTETNLSARALYESLGYRATGGRQPLPSDHSLHECELATRIDSRLDP